MKTTIFSTIMLSALALTACSEETYSPDPDKGWADTQTFFSPTEEQGFSTYYMPSVGTCGDPMPFYDEQTGEFKVYYLQEYSQNGASYHPIFSVKTKDCANYVPEGEVLPAGGAAEQDAGVGTGCRVYDKANNKYYIYYTGHNPNCAQTEAIMRATSTDGKNYVKDAVWMLTGIEKNLGGKDFRDPQIFKGDDGKWNMIITCNKVFAIYTSDDLNTWTFDRSFNTVWGRMSECPDVFKMGDWWYLVYSDQESFGRCVKYVQGHSLEDLYWAIANSWLPNEDEGKLDSRGFFAGKTASNGTDRYIWGWCPFRDGTDIWSKNANAWDNREPNWSGALVCHKLIQNKENGSLTLGPVPGINAKYNKQVTPRVAECSKGASFENGNGTLEGESFVRFGRLAYQNHISFTLKTENPDDKFGVSFVRGDSDSINYRYSSINFNNPHWEEGKRYLRRMEFLQVKQRADKKDPIEFDFINGALSHFIPVPADNTYKIDIYNDNSVVVIYYNGVMCYTTRVYGIQKNGWSINSYGGKVTISDLKVSQY